MDGLIKRRRWTKKDSARLIHLREKLGLDFIQIAERLERTVRQCRSQYSNLKYGRRKKRLEQAASLQSEPHNHIADLRPKISPKALLDRDRREAALREREDASLARGDCTATFFGDPPPGWSALDKRRASNAV